MPVKDRTAAGDYTPPRQPRRKGLTRAIFDILRNADKPLTTGEIAGILGIDANRAGVALNVQRKKGLITGRREGISILWEIVRPS